jgi:hypothetical protein
VGISNIGTGKLVVMILAALLGTLAAVHPFAKITDPAIGGVDQVICPFYALTPLLPELSEPVFFGLAVGSNILLYCFIGRAVTAMTRGRTGG